MNGVGITGDLGLETAFFLKALLTGVALGIYYDLYRILRRLFRFGYAIILGQDVLFWLTGAVGVFFSSMIATGGQLRIVFVLVTLAGWGIYALTIGSLIMAVVDVVLGLLRKMYGWLKKRALLPVKGKTVALSQKAGAFFGEKISRIMQKMREKREKTA